MSQVAVNTVKDAGKETSPALQEVANRFDAIERRAFDLFERRGGELGHELDDWLKAERELLGWPAAELAEKDQNYQIEIALPGFTANDVEVTATPSEIVVHASTSEEKKTHKENVLWTEFGSNDVYRRFVVPGSVNANAVTANLEDGLLRIIAPKAAGESASIEAKAA